MLAKSRNNPPVSSVLLGNPIQNYYEIGEQSATAGPENIWRVYDGYSKEDHKEVSIFLFNKRAVEILHKPKRRETIAEIMRNGAREMERFSHPKLLHVYKVDECEDTLAFASEPVLASLANVLAYQEQRANIMSQNTSTPSYRKGFIKEYELLSIEIKYGLLQVLEALSFLHNSCKIIHRNVCPTSIVITRRGTWKLAGFEFIEKVSEYNTPGATIPVSAWRNSTSKLKQPSLDFLPPEVQRKQIAGYYSDMYSFGMTICAIFNHGRPFIQANHNTATYIKQIENLQEQVNVIIPKIPQPLQEAVKRLLDTEEPEKRPPAQIISRTPYFRDEAVQALQFLDSIKMISIKEKETFYTKTLKDLLPYIPKKLWFQHIWSHLQEELESKEALSSVLQPMFYIMKNCTADEYEHIIFPTFRDLFINPRTIQGMVTLLENLHTILERTPPQYIESDVLRMLYKAFENSTMQVQNAAFIAVANVSEYIKDDAIKTIVLPKLLQAFSKEHSAEHRVLMNVIPCILHRLDKHHIIDDILPLLCNREVINLQDPEILVRVINIYRLMLSYKNIGIPINWMANRAMPSLLPQTVNANLSIEQFSMLYELLQHMLGHIERSQRNKLTRDNLALSSPERHWTLRHQYSTDNMHIAPSNIPNVRVDQRKTSSAEDMARKNSISSISMTASAENMARKNSMAATLSSWFTTTTSSDKNFLNVAANAFAARRLSDNTLITPKIRLGPSCASSPGGTPGGGLPIRRHSASIGPQERRGSSINLSPPTVVFQGLPVTSSSVPYLLSANSLRGSRRTSVSSTSSQPSAGLLQQVGASMYQLFSRQPNPLGR